jgi:hypothetical protein
MTAPMESRALHLDVTRAAENAAGVGATGQFDGDFILDVKAMRLNRFCTR